MEGALFNESLKKTAIADEWSRKNQSVRMLVELFCCRENSPSQRDGRLDLILPRLLLHFLLFFKKLIKRHLFFIQFLVNVF
jgi:hypothetical protein